jgi:hypothetical protein
VDINRTWKTIRENIKISVKASRGWYDWFDEECSKILDERKQDKLQWLQGPS